MSLWFSKTTPETLAAMSGVFRAWMKTGHPLPVFIQKSELQTYADSLPIEFLDMQDHRRVIFGSDPLAGIDGEPLGASRAMPSGTFAIKLLKLRQAVLLADGNEKSCGTFSLDSLPSVLTLYRAALRLGTEVPKGHKIWRPKSSPNARAWMAIAWNGCGKSICAGKRII